MVSFIPEKPTSPVLDVPYFEDSQEKKVMGYGVKRSVESLQKSIYDLLMRLSAGAIHFTPGQYPGATKRYGFQIHFKVNGMPGRIDCAALPMRIENPKKKDRTLAQALYIVEMWLQAEVNSMIYRPGAITLLPYLIGVGGKTVTEALMEQQVLPDLAGYYLPDGNHHG